MKAILFDPGLSVIATLVLALTFARAAWHKLADLDMFCAIAEAYDLAPARLVRVAAPVLAMGEAVIALALVVPASRPWAALTAMALLIAYGVAIAINLGRGRVDIDCGCGGAGEGLSWLLVARNVVLAAAAGVVVAGVDVAVNWSMAGVLAVVLPVAGLWLLMLVVEQLAGNNAQLRQLGSRLREGQ